MGLLRCYNISEAFINHLDQEGPISVEEAVNKYHHVHEMGYNSSEEGRLDECLWSCVVSADFYMRNDIIEPVDRQELFAIKYLDETTITPDQLAWFTASGPAEDVNRLIIREIDGDEWSEYKWAFHFLPIVWKLTDKARNNRDLIMPYWGSEE